jgi:hypothetical protein
MNFSDTIRVVNIGRTIQRNGKPVHLDITYYEVTCSVQPFGGLEVLLVPEGDRQKDMYWVYLQEDSNRPIVVNQTVIYNSLNFQVQKVEQWGSYQRIKIVRLDVGPNQSNNFETNPEVSKTNAP